MADRKLCECGCGEPAPIATRTRREWGYTAGEPVRFIRGHHARRPLAERFAEKVQAADDRSPNGMSGCLLWAGYRDPNGYGRSFDGSMRLAHSVAWELAGGTVPAGLELDHLCRRPACVAVAHLEPVTPKTNMRRSSVPKLNIEQAREIRALRAQGWTPLDIAAAYQISRSVVYQIGQGRLWVEE